MIGSGFDVGQMAFDLSNTLSQDENKFPITVYVSINDSKFPNILIKYFPLHDLKNILTPIYNTGIEVTIYIHIDAIRLHFHFQNVDYYLSIYGKIPVDYFEYFNQLKDLVKIKSNPLDQQIYNPHIQPFINIQKSDIPHIPINNQTIINPIIQSNSPILPPIEEVYNPIPIQYPNGPINRIKTNFIITDIFLDGTKTSKTLPYNDVIKNTIPDGYFTEAIIENLPFAVKKKANGKRDYIEGQIYLDLNTGRIEKVSVSLSDSIYFYVNINKNYGRVSVGVDEKITHVFNKETIKAGSGVLIKCKNNGNGKVQNFEQVREIYRLFGSNQIFCSFENDHVANIR